MTVRIRNRILGTATALVVGAGLLVGSAQAPTAAATAAEPAAVEPLTNLDHLDFLGDTATPRELPRHTTYRLAQEPAVGMLWTYADRRENGFERIGGGTRDPETGHWSQGAYNADDVARAAVVYTRHWQLTGDADSREHAYQLLRGLTYLQTSSGPDAGNVVLWMQPDGELNPSAEPVELPDPSDSDASYWLARTIWALGEAVPAFRDADPRFARFLERRLALSVAAVDRQVLDRYGDYYRADGRRTPAWLIVDGADATAEALLGLAAYTDDGGTPRARRVMRQLAEGVAALSGGDARRWPFGGVLPWGLSRSIWHAWASQMGAALAATGDALDEPAFRTAARRDAFTFDPMLLTTGGPDNGRQPTRADRVQIAYGADSRVQGLLAHGTRAGDLLAGVAASWFFGANPAGVPAYDPATGTTIDGIEADGRVNRNSGAESTIHGLLTMIELDARPAVAELARTATVTGGVGLTELQAEDAALAGGATAVTPESRWTGESQFGGTGYVRLPAGGSATFAVPEGQPASLVLPVTDYRPGSSAVTTYRAAGERVGTVRSGDVGAQGRSPAPGALLPQTLGRLPESDALVARTRGGTATVDAVVLLPLVTSRVLGGDGHGTALLRNAAAGARTTTVTVPGDGVARVHVFDGLGRPVRTTGSTAADVAVTLPAGGFAVVIR